MVVIEEINEPEGDGDYAAAADSFAEQHHSKSSKGQDDDDDDDDDDGDDNSNGEESASGSDDSSKGSDDEDEEEGEKQVKGDNDDDDESSFSEEEEEEETEGDEQEEIKQPSPAEVAAFANQGSSEPCTFDLRNLLAMNGHQVDVKALYSTKKHKKDERVTISTSQGNGDDNNNETISKKATSLPNLQPANEEYLLEKATQGCNQLVRALWQLPIEPSDAGPMARLPLQDESRIPRALPPPEPKQETKWEKFAKERGIGQNKEKRSRKVWDEGTGEWMYRHGYQKANDDVNRQWPIMEVKGNQDPFEDPWERQREAKKARVDKNAEQHMRNQERAGLLPKGTTNRTTKSREKTRKAGKQGGNLDRDNVPLPAGVPVDLRGGRKDVASLVEKNPLKRGKESTMAALRATQRSTASLGKFDQMREGEPERKKTLSSMKRRKYESATDKKVIASENERSLKLLKTVVEGGGVAKEKAIRKGQLAKGETPYDYDYNDGLGPSTFKKRKGRAGAGKARKMTKKRIK